MAEGPPTASRQARPGEHGQFVGSSSFLGHTLPEGTRIGGLQITGLIGEGGFGIVYLAYDESLQREVAVKEYMPSSLASRATGSQDVTVKSERHRETFEAGLRSFVNEARLLARFDHPSLLKVYRFWQANGTAYMAMPYYEGMTLKATLAAMPQPPEEERLREWLMPLLDALTVMHQASCFHRDIAPDNILLTRDGPLLLDFGAARRVIGDMTHALTVVLKPGYAPIEQYGDTPHMQQGAWTDLYALACVVYYAVTGRTPMSSVERMMTGDALEPLSRVAHGRYSAGFLSAIDKALAILPKDRPQDVAQFRALLDAGRRAPARPSRDVSVIASVPPRPLPAAPAAAPAAASPWSDGTTVVGERSLRALSWLTGHRALWLGGAGGVVLLTAAPMLMVRIDGATSDSAAPAAAAPAPAPTPRVEPSAATPASVIEAAAPPAPAPAVAVPEPVPAPVEPVTPTAAAGTAEAPGNVPPDATTAAAEALGLPASAAAAARPREAPRRSARVTAAAPPTMKARPAQCSDILQKASLEPLTADEAAFLRRECR
ncbi:serine/threonine-protein kinase [Piscinibacter sp. XHJ-5]|uniref:serine/threonine protein kinase n=1 Tax=Piscinibacter sp. XHJ-5 TaxID=3037797 RepID=UPI002452901A|nr:serine/threonine-protein kinase [Piscinibacter sp. XHJ-5]